MDERRRMNRDALQPFAGRRFDLLVIGGGIQGAALCWRAAAAGLAVALVERGDFGAATSANSQKVIHGGLRYLQRLDIPRTLESIQAMRHLLNLAPHLVHPMPCLMPLYGYGSRGREAMAVGLGIYNLLRQAAEPIADEARRIPPAVLLGPGAARRRFALAPAAGLRGAALWHDALCENTERLTLAFVRSAQALGAAVANYAEAGAIDRHQDGCSAIHVRDRLGLSCGTVCARHVARCVGPWLESPAGLPSPALALGINLVTPPLHTHPVSVALRQPGGRNGRMYFVVPWRGCSIVGTAWVPYHGTAEPVAIHEVDLEDFIRGFNTAWPGRPLSLGDVRHVHAGLVPSRPPRGMLAAAQPRLQEHARLDMERLPGGGNRLDVQSVKYTTAVTVAETALRRLYPGRDIGRRAGSERLVGGALPDWSRFHGGLRRRWTPMLPADVVDRLATEYGGDAETVIAYGREGSPHQPPDLVAGMVRFAVRHEMARTLADVILRRTGIGSTGLPADRVLAGAARAMAEEMGWGEARQADESRHVLDAYPTFIRRRSER
jgi:glycerol-3-phosphate dehydrogenase